MNPSIGGFVVDWIENNLTHGEGEYLGKPFLLDDWQQEFIWRLYEYHPDTYRRIVETAVLELAKGNGKTPLAAAIMLNELAGPSVPHASGVPQVRSSPSVPIAAGGYDQAGNLYEQARLMVDGYPKGTGRLSPLLETFDKELQLKGRPGKLYRVAAAGGTLDGGLPSAWAADELHEWVIPKQIETFKVLSQNAEKRNFQGGFCLTLILSTPGWDKKSLLGGFHRTGLKIQSGETIDESFLFMHHSPPGDPTKNQPNLDNPQELRAGLAAAYPASWVTIEHLAKKWESPVSEEEVFSENNFRRYFLAQWVASAESYLPGGSWAQLARPRQVADGTPVVLGFDGSYNRDSTALYGWTLDGYGFLIAAWEKPFDASKLWTVPRAEVKAVVADTFSRLRVLRMVCDPAKWGDEIEEWITTYGTETVITKPQTSASMAPACEKFLANIKLALSDETDTVMEHDGNPTVARHLSNAKLKRTPYGNMITKDGDDSPRKIDAAIAAIIGFDEMTITKEETGSPSVMLI